MKNEAGWLLVDNPTGHMKIRIVQTLPDFTGGRVTFGKLPSESSAVVLDDPENTQISEP